MSVKTKLFAKVDYSVDQNPYEIDMCGKYQWKNLVTQSL